MQLLENKWALITGSSRGIGQQIALGLAERKCNIVVHGRDIAHVQHTLELLRPSGVQVHAVAGELATAEGVQAVIDGVGQGPGSVDILYNNAAVQNPWKPLWDITAEDWLPTFQINLFAVIRLCTA